MTVARRVLVINPNTSHAMTDALLVELARHAPPDTAFVGATAAFGCPVISTRASFAIAGHAALDAYASHDGAVDAVILGCFGDPGLKALREIAPVPVVGLAEASFAAATGAFAVLTAGPIWRDMLLEQIALLPQAALCKGVWALEATGHDVRQNPDAFVDALNECADQAVAKGAGTLILGGAVLAGYAPRLRSTARIIDCAQAAVAHVFAVSAKDARARQPGPTLGLSPQLRDVLERRMS